MSKGNIVLRAEGLCAGYGGRLIVKGVSFTLHDGDVLAVVGPNGSGKTTLLRALLGMIRPEAGRVEILGSQGMRPQDVERTVAYIPQRLEVDRTFPISLREMLDLSAPEADVERFLDFLELRPLLDKRVGDLSGGQLQRAMMAYAAAKGPRLLVMDEPTSWVDAKGADCALCIMEEFKSRGIALLVVTHDFSSLEGIATHVLGLSPALESGYFFGPVTDEDIAGRAASLFGISHHGGANHVHCAFSISSAKGEGHGDT
jgi:zinc transport system ATP-binding protein